MLSISSSFGILYLNLKGNWLLEKNSPSFGSIGFELKNAVALAPPLGLKPLGANGWAVAAWAMMWLLVNRTWIILCFRNFLNDKNPAFSPGNKASSEDTYLHVCVDLQ